MLNTKHLLALAAAALMAGCGGGESPATTHEAAASAMRARALAAPSASAVAPDEAARQLMNYGESVFPMYFPEHQTTLTYGPFKYRAYSSGILLGVVVSANPDYTLNGVYVMGGAFGNAPLYVGQLTAFITPIDPGTNPTGPNNGCADLSLVETQGTRLIVAYSYTGAITGNVSSDTLVGALTSFEGQQAREVTTKTTGTTAATINTEIKNYVRKTGEAEVTNYGSIVVNKSSVEGVETTSTIKSVWSPAWVDRRYALAVGASLTYSQTGSAITTTTFTLPGLPPTTTTNTSAINSTDTVKYLGQEAVTVPAGSYNACKYEHTSAAGGATSTTWLTVGKGIPVKTVSGSGAEMVTTQATSISLNGQPL